MTKENKILLGLLICWLITLGLAMIFKNRTLITLSPVLLGGFFGFLVYLTLRIEK
jgi:hypothetical protein